MRSCAAETSDEIMWMKSTSAASGLRTAENASISLSFSALPCTGSKSEDCYTFEHFAARDRVIRTTYYYYYQRTRFGLKEETRWS